MDYRAETLGVTFVNLPEGCDLSCEGKNASLFAPNGVDLAVYEESQKETPRTDFAMRRELAEGRTYIAEFTGEEQTDDGWLVRFRTEDDKVGFELGRVVDGRRLVFWSGDLRDDTALATAIAWCRTAKC